MKRYVIPIGMGAGSLIGLLAGIISSFSVQVTMCIGAALGIILGAAAQIIVNYMYPDEYFSKKKKKDEVSEDSLFSELSGTAANADPRRTSPVYHDGRIVEESDDDDINTVENEERWEAQYHDIQRRKQQANGQQRNMDNRPPRGRPPQGRPEQGRPVQGWPEQGRQPQGRPQQGRPAQNRPAQDRPTYNRSTQDLPPYGNPPQNRSPERPPAKPPVKQPAKKRSIFDEPDISANYSNKKRVIVEEDDD